MSALLSAAPTRVWRSRSLASQLASGFLRSHSFISADAICVPGVLSAKVAFVLPSHRSTSTAGPSAPGLPMVACEEVLDCAAVPLPAGCPGCGATPGSLAAPEQAATRRRKPAKVID